LNHLDKWEKAWNNSFVIKLQGELNHDVSGLGFSNYGNIPTHVITISYEYCCEVHELMAAVS